MSLSVVYPLQALLIGLLAIEVLRQSAKRIHLVDVPNHRKLHGGEVPVVGGIGIFCAFLLSAIVVPGLFKEYAFLFAPALALTLLGLFDDIYDLKPVVKLAGQFAIAALVLVSNPQLALRLGDGHDLTLLQAGLWIVTLLVLVGVMNSFNMLDGVDGLAGAVTGVALILLIVAAAISELHPVVLMAVQLLMPVLAFLFFNARAPWRRVAIVFLGDAGSLLLGFGVAVLGLQVIGSGPLSWSPLAIAFVVALPVMDTASLVLRRLAVGRNPLSADRRHLHHLLQDAGLTAGQVTALMTAGAALIGGLGLALDFARVGSEAMISILLALFAGHCVLVRWLGRRIERRLLVSIVTPERPRRIDVAPLPDRVAAPRVTQSEFGASN